MVFEENFVGPIKTTIDNETMRKVMETLSEVGMQIPNKIFSVSKSSMCDNNGFICEEELQTEVKQYFGPDPLLAQVTEEISNVRDKIKM